MYARLLRIRDRIADRTELWLAQITARTSRRSRLAGSILIASGLHVLLLWMLVAANPEIWNLDTAEIPRDYEPVELWALPQPEPDPETVPIVPVIVPHQVETPKEQKQEQTQEKTNEPVREQAVETPQPEAPRTPQQVKPVVAPQLSQPQDPIIAGIPKDRALDSQAARVPDAPAKRAAPARVKKKEDEVNLAEQDNPGRPSDLHLHEAADIKVPALAKVPASGLTPASGGGSRLDGMKPGGLPTGAGGGLNGGRGQVTQALQNHDYCVAAQKAGKPIPAGCNMTDLAGQNGMGPRPDANLQATVAAKDRNARYKAQPGNTEYWQRVNKTPTPNDRDDDLPKKGAYSNSRDQRVLTGGSNTADPGGE